MENSTCYLECSCSLSSRGKKNKGGFEMINNPIKDIFVLGMFVLVSPIYLFCDIFSGGLDK